MEGRQRHLTPNTVDPGVRRDDVLMDARKSQTRPAAGLRRGEGCVNTQTRPMADMANEP